MKTLLLISMLTLTAPCAMAAAQEHDLTHHSATMQATSQNVAGTGVVKEIDAGNGKIKIAHEPIAALGWPAMTMWFAMQTQLPKNIKTGDGVKFELMQGDKHQWVIVRIAGR